MPSGLKRISTLDKHQRAMYPQLFEQAQLANNPLYQQGSNALQQLLSGSPEAYQAFEAPFMRQFREETIPELSNLFAGLGGGRSSSFQQALGQSAAGLSEKLAALRAGLQAEAIPQALAYSQQPFANLRSLFDIQSKAYMPRSQPFWKSLLGGAAGGFGQGFGQGGGLAALKLIGLI